MPRRSKREITIAWKPEPKKAKELILACYKGKITLVRAMLKKGVDPNERVGSTIDNPLATWK